MIRTIMLGSYVSVQGIFIRMLDNGRIMVRDGDRTFVGVPVTREPNPTGPMRRPAA